MIKQRFEFSIASKLLSDILVQGCANQKNVKCKCETVDFELVTWIFLVGSSKFFSAHRSNQETQLLLNNLVTHKFATQNCVWITKAKITMDKHLSISVLEDISQQ
jgi:hypothetical protein